MEHGTNTKKIYKKRRRVKKKRFTLALLGMAFLLLFCIIIVFSIISKMRKDADAEIESSPPNDPWSSMIEVPYGSRTNWILPDERLKKSSFSPEDFVTDGQFISCVKENYQCLRGIDVSFHQREIDWQAVAESGVQFAYIRAGYRGYTEGVLQQDTKFEQNLLGASENGLLTGVYFFSQATNEREASEEAEYLLELIEGMEEIIDLPIVFDWEFMANEDSRTKQMQSANITEMAQAFIRVIQDAGFDTGIYFNHSIGYYGCQLGELADTDFWFSAPGEWPDFYYDVQIWQYSFRGRVPGIEPDVDLNLMMINKE